MRRPASRRLTSTRVIIIANLAAIALLFGFVQWQFSKSESSTRPMRMTGEYVDTTEQDLRSKSFELENMAKHTFEHDTQLRKLAPPVDWEGIASEGAKKYAAIWEATTDKSWWKQPGYLLSYPEEDPPYPFQRVKSVDGKDTGIVMIIAPFYDTNYYRAEAARSLFWRLKAKGHIMVGITSYQEFPGQVMNPFDDRHTTEQDAVIHSAVEAWLHCFREPEIFLPPGVPRLLLSESDFHDPERNDGGAGGTLIPDANIKKEYDLVYSNQGGEWNDFARNWTLAKDSIKALINELDFKILVLGRDLTKDEDKDLQPFIENGRLTSMPPGRPWKEFLKSMQTGRSLFVPNIHDASPRVIAEALCLNVPIVVNTHILGGWKYVNQYTGEFFSDATDVVAAYRKLRSPDRAAELFPREWYKATWGKSTASYKLQAFMEAVVGTDRLQAVQRDLEAFHAKKQNPALKLRR